MHVCASQGILSIQECEEFMAKGISGSGTGFDAASVGRLGGKGPVPIHNPPSHRLRDVAAKVMCLPPTVCIAVRVDVAP